MALKTLLYLMSFWQRWNKTLLKVFFYVSQNYGKMNKISEGWNYIFPYVWYYSLNVLKTQCSSTWDSSWLLRVFLFLWSPKTVCKLPYNYKSLVLIWNFFKLEIELYCEKSLCTHFDRFSKVEANKKWK